MLISQKYSTKIECSDYTVKIENKATHICVENWNGENPHLEIDNPSIQQLISKKILYLLKFQLIQQIMKLQLFF